MKIIALFNTSAMTFMLAAGVVSANDQTTNSSSFAAGVSLLAPEQTGFLYGGTVEVTGLGSGAVVISAGAAEFNMTGFANSSTGYDYAPEAVANSGVLTTFQFDRTVTASGSSIGVGRVVAKGDANASVGSVGSAFGETLANAIQVEDAGTRSSTSNAASESAASLVGEGSTSVLAGLIGTGSGFVGSTGTSVTSTQLGVSYSALNAYGDQDGTGINITPGDGVMTFAALSTEMDLLGTGDGIVGHSNGFTLGDDSIDLAVSNVGGGTISLGATTGGFFAGGSAVNGSAGFASTFDFN